MGDQKEVEGVEVGEGLVNGTDVGRSSQFWVRVEYIAYREGFEDSRGGGEHTNWCDVDIYFES